MKMILKEWIDTNNLILSSEDIGYLEDVMDESGTIVECDDSATDWSFWIGSGVMIETNTTGTRVIHGGRFSVTTKIGYYDLRESESGMTAEETAIYVADLDWPVYAVRD